jgi:hypothetical protein
MSSETPEVLSEKVAKVAKVAKSVKKVAHKVVKHLTSESSSSAVSEAINKKLSLVDKVLGFTKHPKFKWIVFVFIVVVGALTYFKYQKILKERLLSAKQKMQSPQELLKQTLQNQLKKQFDMEQMHSQQAHVQQVRPPVKQVKQTKKEKKVEPPPPESSSEDTSDEEVFLEDPNIMKHNLTQEEMYAIDRQLEDVNLENLNHE